MKESFWVQVVNTWFQSQVTQTQESLFILQEQVKLSKCSKLIQNMLSQKLLLTQVRLFSISWPGITIIQQQTQTMKLFVNTLLQLKILNACCSKTLWVQSMISTIWRRVREVSLWCLMIILLFQELSTQIIMILLIRTKMSISISFKQNLSHGQVINYQTLEINTQCLEVLHLTTSIDFQTKPSS